MNQHLKQNNERVGEERRKGKKKTDVNYLEVERAMRQ